MQTYLFYDIETTGLNKAFDQILHFAAIRTDLNLKELERYEIKIKLNPDVIPSPGALITHKMGIKEITNGVPEHDAIKEIHQYLNTPGTISLGYNTLGFDDEFLRFSFYRNLLKPYTHQYANQCYRMDIYPMTVMFFLFKNAAIHWPPQNNLKLENINTANQFVSGRSHHAMVDVEVTLELAKRFLAEREMWEYLHGYFKKEIDNQRMQLLQKEIAILVSGKLGNRFNYGCPIVFLGNHQHYKNQSVWLRLDTEDLNQTTLESIPKTTQGINKKPGEPNFILPCKERFLQHITDERMELAKKNVAWLENQPDMLKEIMSYHIHYKYPVFPETDIDARLYMDGFLSPEEEFFCTRFHKATPKEKANLLQQTTSARLKILGLRILGRHYPETLSLKESQEFADYLQQTRTQDIIDYQGKKRLTPAAALQEIQTLRKERELDEGDLKLLMEYEEYLLPLCHPHESA